jgi:hypothetical protein
MERITEGATDQLFVEEDKYKVQSTVPARWVEDETWDNFMWSRYRIGRDDMLSYINLLKKVNVLPVMVSHPILDKLVNADY